MKRFFFWKRLNKKQQLYFQVILAAFLIVVVPLAISTLRHPAKSEAAWFDDQWSYRKAVEIATHTASENSVYINLTGANDIDTATLITADKMQADCDDLRFTKANGELLSYYIASGCNSADTVVHVFFDTFPSGAQTIYFYYGNPSASSGQAPSDFTTEASNYTFGTLGSEETTEGPIAYWAFDDGQGQTAQDSTSENNDGTLGADTGSSTDDPSWQTEDMCVSDKCLKFDGGDFVNGGSGSSLENSSLTVGVWLKPTAISSQLVNYFISKIDDDDGTNDKGWAFGFVGSHTSCNGVDGTPYIYETTTNTLVCATTAMTINNWYYLVFTNDGTTTKIYVNGRLENSAAQTWTEASSSNLNIGRRSDGIWYTSGFIDEVKVYNYIRTADQVKADYNSRGSVKGASAQIGSSDQRKSLSNGLVGYWKMDEASGNFVDSSGNSLTATVTGSTVTGGVYGNGRSFNGTSDTASVGNTAILNPSAFTVSIWVKKNSEPANYDRIYEKMNYDPPSDSRGWEIDFDNTTPTRKTLASMYTTTGTQYAWTGNTLTIGTWRLITFTFDGKTGKYFENGVQVGAAQDMSGTFGPSTRGLFFASASDGISKSPVTLDEARYYNRALSPKEVSDLYNWAPGPVGYWRMDDPSVGSGQAKIDSSGYGNNGTTNSANGTGMDCTKVGKYGKACQFDGTDDYIDLSTGSSLNVSGPVTVESWFKPSTVSDYHVISAKSGGTASNTQYELRQNSAAAEFTISNGTTNYTASYSSAFSINNWYHVVGTFDGTTLKVYVNGIKGATDGTLSGTQSSCSVSCNPSIGRRGDGLYVNGLIDEVKIYNYVRTQKQIVEDMQGGAPAVSAKTPVGYWDFDEGQGQTTNNSGNGGSTLNGTLGATTGSSTDDPAWSNSGKFGKALNFDGGDFIGVSTLSSTSQSYTFSFWLNSSVAAGTYDYLFDSQTGRLVIAHQTDTSGKLGWYDGTWHSIADTVRDGLWHNLVFVLNSATTTGTVYKDGQVLGTAAYTPVNIGGTSRIGNVYNATSQGYVGLLDEVKIYNYSLTADEVKIEYNRGSSLVLGALGNNSTYEKGATNQEYCVPGDSTSCAAPVAEWKFEEGSGTSAKDTSGNNYAATWYGSTSHWTTGKIGKAGNFGGTTPADYAEVASGTFPAFSSSITLSVWVKLANTTGNKMVLARYDGVTSRAPYYLNIIGDEVRPYFAKDWSSNYIYKDTTATNLLPNKWYYIEATYTLSAADINIYVNGILQSGTVTKGGTVSSLQLLDSPVTIGAYKTGASTHEGYFAGQIDDVRIFNYARSAAQVAYDYNRGKPVGYWDFDECQGNTAYDSSGNGNSGTITIGATIPQTTTGTCTSPTDTSGAWYNGRNGKYNSSMSFDGADDYINIGDPSSGIFDFGTTASFTISGWIKIDMSAQSELGFVVSKYSGDALYEIFANTNGTIAFQIRGSNGVGLTTSTSTSSVEDVWAHFTAVRSVTDDKIRIYVNGVKEDEDTDDTTATLAGTGELHLGVRDPTLAGNDYWLKGQIDDVRIYNYALTSSQVKLLYNNGAVNFGPDTGSP